MSRESHVPTYRKHKQSGQAVVTLPDGLGSRRDILLGKYGSKESRQEYARVIAEWEAGGRALPQSALTKDLTINELILRFWSHAEEHYRHADGTPTNELNDFRLSLRPLRRLYGHTPAKDFGPLALKAVRKAMLSASWLTAKEKDQYAKQGWPTVCCRGVVNQRIGRIRRMFRWGVEEELVPSSVLHGLEAVRGLQKGRSAARETDPVKPVAETDVNATLPHLMPQVAAMVQLQLLTGMRPGEVVLMRGMDLDTSGAVWLYRPGSDRGPCGEHKTAWRGHSKVIAIGPRAQEILKPWLRLNLQEYLFQPREAMAAYWAERRKTRKTKIQPSQQNRRKRKPKRAPGGRYKVTSYAVAIARGCVKASVPHWHPHQLRHTKATEIRREAGLDAARAVLGHRSPRITETYAEIDVNKAAEVIARLG